MFLETLILLLWTQTIQSLSVGVRGQNMAVSTAAPDFHCAEYRSKTTIFNASMTLNLVDLRYRFIFNAMDVTFLNYTSVVAQSEAGQLELYSSDTFAQSCFAASDDTSLPCVMHLSMTHKYEFSFRTTSYADGFIMFLGEEDEHKFVAPSLNPCHIETNTYKGGTRFGVKAKTELCCIAKMDGAWPGSTYAISPIA